jgi:hypothetical protein
VLARCRWKPRVEARRIPRPLAVTRPLQSRAAARPRGRRARATVRSHGPPGRSSDDPHRPDLARRRRVTRRASTVDRIAEGRA